MTAVPMAVLLELAATHSGFDVDLAAPDGWLGFASTQSPLRVWLSASEHGGLVAALSMTNVADVLAAEGTGSAAIMPLPEGAVAARTVGDRLALQHLLRHAWTLARTLPDALLHEFERSTAHLPRGTEVERLVVQRVGQEMFRDGLLDYWQRRCAVTGLAVPALLRASHIKPWADCDTDAERLDVYNGLLLAPHVDAAFDLGFITVADDGAVVISDALDVAARAALGLDAAMRVRHLEDRHRVYLGYHGTHCFKRHDPTD